MALHQQAEPIMEKWDQEREFTREPVAVLVAAIIATIINPMDADASQMPHGPLRQFAESHPESSDLVARIASLLIHFDVRAEALQKYGMPDHLASEYQKLIELVINTALYQLSFSGATGQTPH